VLALLQPGVAIATDSKQLYFWNADENHIEKSFSAPKGLRTIIRGDDGRLFASIANKVAEWLLTAGHFRAIAIGPAEHLSIAGNTLWYAVDQELRCLDI
jgi:hypothetical protein